VIETDLDPTLKVLCQIRDKLNSSGFGCEVRTVLGGTLGFELCSRVGTEPRTHIEIKLEGELSFVTGPRTVIEHL